MIKYLLLFLLPFSLYASKILSYNIYERSDRADVMITFDTPYTGTIKQSKGKNRIIIKLEDASIESSKNKKVNSDFLHSIKITPLQNQVHVLAAISPNVRLIASKTSDAYGLRLRFTNKTPAKNSTNANATSTDLSALPTKKGIEISTSYYLVVGLLIIGVILLLIAKRKMQLPKNKPVKNSWLFNSIQEVKHEQKSTPSSTNTAKKETSNVSIRFQKAINTTNSVVMLDFADESYLVLMGNSNILLDKFKGNKPSSQEEFEDILQERNQELEDFLGAKQEQTIQAPQTHTEALQSYKERAASLVYNDEI